MQDFSEVLLAENDPAYQQRVKEGIIKELNFNFFNSQQDQIERKQTSSEKKRS